MTLGSFTLGGKRIDVESDWSDIDGRVYRFIQADPRQQVAVTTRKGLSVAEGAPFGKTDLQDGLLSVLRRPSRI